MWVPPVECFEDAAALDREQLQIVLDAGRPEQRVWAIWALALRNDGKVGAIGGRAPDAGARRTLAVVLAGHGEVKALIELATHDPDELVRGTAIQLVTRLAAGGAVDRATGVAGSGRGVIETAIEQDPAVRIAALGAIGRGAPQFLISIAHRLLNDPDVDVAGEAFEALLRLETREGRDAARVWLLKRPDPWAYVFRWLRAGDVRSLAEAVSSTKMEVRGRVLGQLRSPPWEAVNLLIGKDLELLRAVLGRVDIAIPSTTLARAILRGAHEGFARRLVEQIATAGGGQALLADIRAAIAAELDANKLRTIWERVRRYADAVEIPDRHALLDDIVNAHPVEQLLGLDNAVSRWVTVYDAPPELLPLLDELRPYCERLRERLQLNGADLPPAHAQLGGGRNDHASYLAIVDLLAAIDRLRARI